MLEVDRRGSSPSGARTASACTSRRAATSHDMGDTNPAATFGYVATRTRHARTSPSSAPASDRAPDRLGPELKAAFGGVYIANEGFTRDTAEQVVAAGEADAVAFGKLFIANPDLPARVSRWRAAQRAGTRRPSTAPAPKGYTDYPALDGKAAAAE